MAKTDSTLSADRILQETIRQMLKDWTSATPEQRAEAMRLAAISAARAERGR